MAGDSNTVPNELLKQTFFSKQKEKSTHQEQNMQRKLREILKNSPQS
jgi:hypothetical protein